MSEQSIQNIQQFLRDLMKYSGLKGATLARKAGFAPSTVNKYLSDNPKHLMKQTTLEALARTAQHHLFEDISDSDLDQVDDFILRSGLGDTSRDDLTPMQLRWLNLSQAIIAFSAGSSLSLNSAAFATESDSVSSELSALFSRLDTGSQEEVVDYAKYLLTKQEGEKSS